jgi:hypothetical protein
MRRLALVLSAGVALPLLAGCPTSPGVAPTLEVRWALKDANGDPTTCAQAPVATAVNVIVDNALAARNVPCADGVTRITGLAPGVHRVTVEVRDASGVLVYRDWYDATLGESGVSSHAATPGRGTLRIAYTTSSGTCWETGDPLQRGGYIWFRLLDKAYGSAWAAVTEASSDADKQFYACGNYAADPVSFKPIRLNVPFGTYTLKWIKDVRFPISLPPERTDLYLNCTPTDVEIKSKDFKDLPITLDEVTAVTPACPP